MKTALRSLLLLVLALLVSQPTWAAKPQLKFRSDGTFKIVMMSDVQDDESLDPRATALMEKVLDTEKPDFVVIGGDCIAGGICDMVDDVKKAISSIAYPMERRKIPWAIVFGNHDQEHEGRTHMDKTAVLQYYASFPCNLNVRGDTKIRGAGNDDLLIMGRDGKPAFCAWLVDSGSYGPKGVSVYDWIHADQVNWYYRTSRALQAKYGRNIPGLMFFHIPVQEFTQMWNAGKAKGDRFENEGSSKIHSAIFAAAKERGDVLGMFCGHEHINNYVGEWKGIKLGYDAAIGYYEYNLPDSDPNHVRTRGARVFLIRESDPWHFETWMRFLDDSTGH